MKNWRFFLLLSLSGMLGIFFTAQASWLGKARLLSHRFMQASSLLRSPVKRWWKPVALIGLGGGMSMWGTHAVLAENSVFNDDDGVYPTPPALVVSSESPLRITGENGAVSLEERNECSAVLLPTKKSEFNQLNIMRTRGRKAYTVRGRHASWKGNSIVFGAPNQGITFESATPITLKFRGGTTLWEAIEKMVTARLKFWGSQDNGDLLKTGLVAVDTSESDES